MRHAPPLLAALLLTVALAPARGQSWDRDIQPLLQAHCTKCHGGAKQQGGLDLRSQESAIKGGESGPALVAQQPGASLLFKLVQPGSDPHMPPEKQLSHEEIRALHGWITALETADPQAAQDTPPPRPPRLELPAGIDPTLATDLFIQAGWREAGVAPAPRASDPIFLRRVFLDLLGRIPTSDERDAFLAATDSDKRAALIDRLTGSAEHAAHLAEIFNVVFLDREDGRDRKRGEREPWLAYLRWAFETNRPWDEVGRDLLIARPDSAQLGGASWFLYEQRDDHQQMAARAAAALLGKQVQCAQCHDHPVSPEIEQRHYWGLVAFFSRSLNVKTPDGPRVAERASGGYAQFSNLKGESSETELVLIGGTQVAEPGGRRDEDQPGLYAVAPPDQWFKKLAKDEKLRRELDALPVPIFSRREAFADAATRRNPDFSRAIVNRLWAIVFGRGLVHPIDRMDSAHPASHPELLDWLAADFAASGYDVRRLLRALVKTQAYQLGPPAGDGGGRPPGDALFARALDKPLSGEALYRSMRVAAGYGSGADEGLRASFVAKFPDLFADVYSPSVQQAMFVTNGTLIDQLLGDGAPLLQALTQLESPAAIARQAFREVLGREPDGEELARSVEFLGTGGAGAIRHFCWALLASAEFSINH